MNINVSPEAYKDSNVIKVKHIASGSLVMCLDGRDGKTIPCLVIKKAGCFPSLARLSDGHVLNNSTNFVVKVVNE